MIHGLAGSDTALTDVNPIEARMCPCSFRVFLCGWRLCSELVTQQRILPNAEHGAPNRNRNIFDAK
jgi:hypothetical protein